MHLACQTLSTGKACMRPVFKHGSGFDGGPVQAWCFRFGGDLAGMVGAQCNNNMGVCGVAPNVRRARASPHQGCYVNISPDLGMCA